MTNNFEPSPKIRSFDGRKFVGKMVTLELQHLSNEKESGKSQYVSIRSKALGEYEVYASGWAPVLGKKGSSIKRRIQKILLIEHSNGGRGNSQTANSYKEFFNKERKKRVQSHWTGGLLGRISSPGGDPDQADILIQFDGFQIDSYAWSFKAPEEWYSEMFQGNYRFKFVDGFYTDAQTAINKFSQKKEDDMFGERYFPVIVFPKSKIKIAKEIAGSAKNCSKVIVFENRVIIGTRCKPYEYSGVIEDTYKNGGLVPIGQVWDWD